MQEGRLAMAQLHVDMEIKANGSQTAISPKISLEMLKVSQREAKLEY